MISENYYSDNAKLKEYFESIIDWDRLVELHEAGYKQAKDYKESGNQLYEMAPSNLEEAKELYRSILDTVGDLAGNHIAQHNKEIELQGLKLENGKVIFPEKMVELVDMFIESGVMPSAIGRDFGGLQLPVTVAGMATEILSRASSATSIALAGFNLAEFIEKYADDELKKEYIPRMAAGEMTGAMALTEPDYGSNLPNLKTKAVKDKDGVWRITGTKIFITHGCGMGDRPAVILTLARTGESKGAKGLSFFVVESTDVEVVRIEEKMGLHSSPTCQLSFENAPAKLIGKEGHGLVKYSMDMMNGARFLVAAQGVGLAQAALSEAVHYASVREQFGKQIEDIPAVKLLLDRMHMEVDAMRALMYEAGYMVDMSHGLSKKLAGEGKNDREIRKDPEVLYFEKLAKVLTPLSKLYATEKVNQVAYDALQTFGGHGFTHEYDVATITCDARITAIYEGTSQLQVVAAIGGIVEGLAAGGVFGRYLEDLNENYGNDILNSAFTELKELTAFFKELPKDVKDYRAWSLVFATTGLLNSLLLQRLAKRTGNAGHQGIADDYTDEYSALLAAEKIRLKKAVKDSVASNGHSKVAAV